MKLTSPQLTAAGHQCGRPDLHHGHRGRLNAGDTLALDLTGLPARSNPPRYAVVGLAS